MPKYLLRGRTYNILESDVEDFLTLNPSATLENGIEGNQSPTNQGAFVEPRTAPDMDFKLGSTSWDTQEDPTWVERTLGKNIITDFFGDIWRAGEQGFATAEQVGENLRIYGQGPESTDRDIMEFITETNKARGVKMSDEMMDFQRIYEEEGKGIWGFLKGVLHNPTVIPQVFASSMATLAGSFFDAPEVAAAGLTAAGAGMAMGSMTGPGAIVTAPMGGIAGLFGGVAGAMETGLTFGELMQEELRKEGKEFNKENVRDFLNNEEKFKDLKRRAVGRGISIGAIESFGGIVAGGVGAKLWTGSRRVGKEMISGKVTPRPVAGTLAAIGIESVAGGTGEVVGRKMARQEMDVAEIGFEAVAGTATAPINLAAALLSMPSVKMVGRKATKADAKDMLENGTDAEIINARIEVKNDPTFAKEVHDREQRIFQRNIIKKTHPFLSDEEVEEVIDIQNEINELNPHKNKSALVQDWINTQLEQMLFIIEKSEGTQKIQKDPLTQQEEKRDQEQIEKGAEERLARQKELIEKHLGIPGWFKNIEKKYEDDKNFSIKNIKVLKDKGVPIPWFEFSTRNELKEGLMKLTEDDNFTITKEDITDEFLDRLMERGGEIQDGIFFVNKTKALMGNPFVFSHETGHHIFASFVDSVPELVKKLKPLIGTKHVNKTHAIMEQKLYETVLDEEGKTQEEIDEWNNTYANEFVANYIELLKNNELSRDDSILKKIGEFIKEYILKPLGFSKEQIAGFDTPEQVLAFINAYAREDVSTVKKAIEGATVVKKGVKAKGASKPFTKLTSKQKASVLEDINNLIPSNVKTKEQFQNPRVFNNIYRSVTMRDRVINNYIRSRAESPKEANMIIQNVGDRLISFDPEETRADGSVVGIEGFGEFIFANTKFGKLDAKQALAIEGKRTKKTISLDESQETGKLIQIADETTDADIVYRKFKSKATEKDKMKMAVILDLVGKQQLKNVIDYYTNIQTKTIDWSDNKLSEMNYANVKDMAPDITKKLFGELTEKERKGKTKKEIDRAERERRKKFIRDNAKTLHELLPFGEMTIAAGEKGLQSSTRIVTSVLKNFYTKKEATEETTGRGTTTASGLPQQIKNKFNQKIYDDLFGPDPSIDLRNVNETLLPAYIKEIGKAFTNSVLRAELTSRGVDPNVINVLGDGRSEILASQSFVFDTDGIMHKTQDAINSEMGGKKFGDSKIDPKPKTITKTEDIENPMYEKFIKKYPIYEKGDGTIGNLQLKHFRQYVEEYNGRKTYLINNPNEEIVGPIKGPSKAGISDFTEKGKRGLSGELKSKQKDRHGGIGFKWNGKELVQGDNVIAPETFDNLIKAARKAGFYSQLKKWIVETKAEVNIPTPATATKQRVIGGIRVDKTKHENWKKNNKLPFFIFPLNNVDLILEHNNKSDILIHQKEDAVYKLNDRIKSNITPLKGASPNKSAMQLELRLKPSGTIKGTNKRGITIGVDMRLTNIKKSNTKWSTFKPGEPLASKGIKVKYYNDLSIENMFKQHDHTYHYSDDRKNFDKGRRQAEIINNKIVELGGWTKELVNTWNKYAPKSMQMVFDDLTIEERGGPITDKDKATRLKEARKISGETLASKQINIDREFNKILEETKGVAQDKIVGDIDALIQGRKKDKPRFWIPYSAEDFEGMTRYFAGKGKAGDRHIQFFENYLFRPLTEAQMVWDSAKLKADNQWKDIRKAIRKSGIDLSKQVKSKLEPNLEKYTNEQVIRAAMWLAKGTPVDGIDVKEAASIMRYVRTELEFTDFMEQLYNIFPEKLYPILEKAEAKHWLSGTILTDILDSFNNKNTRAEYFKEFWANAEQMFGKLKDGKLVGTNANKIRSIYGDGFMDSLGNVLHRIRTGRNREYGPDKHSTAFMNWTNDAVGTIMFFNTRSALLQMISFANFINWTDNNAMAATARFMDQKQYWNDFAMIFNSDFLKSRRRGLRTDVNADEIANAAATSKNKIKAAISAILKLGFLPTQIADSLAIAIGGASFYRNRYNSLRESGMSKKDAEKQAFRDFQALTTAAQQSSLPWRVSKQQAGPLGRIVLAFQNTPMQYARLIKKAAMDLKNGRGDFKANLSKLVYYAAIQNIIFHGLQSALFALMFTDEDEEERKKAYQNVGNRIADSLLIGTGIYGAITATTKNVILEIIAQEKSGRKDFEKAAIKSTSLSPPLSSKLQKLLRASRRFQYKQEREKIREMGISSQNPAVISAGEVLSAVFNLPADRAIRKWNNLVKAADSETELWQSVALALGYSEWDVKLMENQKEPKVGIVRKRSKSKGSIVRKRKK